MSTFNTRWGNLAISMVRRRMALNVGNMIPASTFSSQLISQRWIGIVACLKSQLEPIEKRATTPQQTGVTPGCW